MSAPAAPTYIVQKGDVLSVPATGLTPVTIEWQQNFGDKKASYHTALVNVKGKGECRYQACDALPPAMLIKPLFALLGSNDQVLFFIQSEWYQDSARMAGIASKVGDHYELKVDDKTRYGQKNTKGEARFIVYHDTSRNPYQHRFMNQALRANALGLGQKVAQMLGVPGNITDAASQQVQALLGDALRSW
ncbi:hypothetical protein FRC07_003155 [Ceratobasidium sp. 392]|nr:hypothetical protein FRC07_003155 [Ceratobasidium sp. 392]